MRMQKSARDRAHKQEKKVILQKDWYRALLYFITAFVIAYLKFVDNDKENHYRQRLELEYSENN